MIRTLLRAVLVVCLLGGCSPRDQRTCTRNEDCGPSATCTDGVCLGQVPAVAITAPSGPAFTSGILPVEVSVANCVPDKVELLANGVPLTSLDSQRTYGWDTSGLREGAYQLAVRAIVGGEVVTSEPRTVVVDRTVPAVIARSPQGGDGNVPFGTPFEVTFSEPMLPASVTDATVMVTDSDTISLPKHVVLSADGRTLNITLSRAPSLPVQVRVSLVGLTDLAGNALASTGAWAFTVQMASDHLSPTIVARVPEAGDANVPVDVPFQVTFSEPIRPESVNDGAVLVTGNGGVALSKRLALSLDSRTLSITLAGIPILPTAINIDFQGLTDLAGNLVAPQETPWSFTIPDWWRPWQLPLNHETANGGYAPSLALDSQGKPIVALLEYAAARQALVVRAWDGTAWRDLGGTLNRVADAWSPSLALSADGTPFLAWFEYVNGSPPKYYVFVAKWDGTEWKDARGGSLRNTSFLNVNTTALSVTPDPPINVALVVDTAGRPTVAFPEPVTNGAATVYTLRVRTLNGLTWEEKPGSPSSSTARHTVAVALSLLDELPLVATVEKDDLNWGGSVYVRVASATGWNSSYGTGSLNGDIGDNVFGAPSVVTDASGKVVVAYAGVPSGASKYSIYVKQRSPGAALWTSLGDSLSTDSSTGGRGTNVRLDANGHPIVASYGSWAVSSVVVEQWNGIAGWTQVGGSLNTMEACAGISLGVASDGLPVIAWSEWSGVPGDGVHVPCNVLLSKLNR